jgi:hypothetical protein
MAPEDGNSVGSLAGWQAFGPTAFASALAPWFSKLIEAALIPEWYATSLNVVSSVIGPLICFLIWFTCEKLSRRRQISVAYISLFVFVFSFIFVCKLCIYLNFNIFLYNNIFFNNCIISIIFIAQHVMSFAQTIFICICKTLGSLIFSAFQNCFTKLIVIS